MLETVQKSFAAGPLFNSFPNAAFKSANFLQAKLG